MRHKILFILIGIIGLSFLSTTIEAQSGDGKHYPFSRTAIKSGNWNDRTIWGKPVPKDPPYPSYEMITSALPTMYEKIIIPAGITVTIPANFELLHLGNGDGEGMYVSGTLVVAGKLIVEELEISSGGAFTNNSGGSVTLNRLFVNRGGTVTNKGAILSQAPWAYNYATFSNEAGAVIDNRGEFSTDGGSFTNRGTITNNFSFKFYSATNNYGTITNANGRQMGIYREFHNQAGSKLTNLGSFIIHGCCKTFNDGTFENKGTYFQNDGGIVNSCTGTFTGTQVDKITNATDCPAIPSPGWTSFGGQTSFANISAGSASNITGTGLDGNLLRWSGSSFAPDTPAVPMKQASIAADGTLWGVKADGTIYRWNGTSWIKIAGELKQISVGSAAHIWGVNSANLIWKWTGTTWVQVSGALTNVSVGADGAVWGVNSAGQIWKWTGTTWTLMPGSAAQISVGSASKVWIVDSAGNVSKWNGTGWDAVPSAGLSKQVALATDGTVLVLRTDNTLYRMQ